MQNVLHSSTQRLSGSCGRGETATRDDVTSAMAAVQKRLEEREAAHEIALRQATDTLQEREQAHGALAATKRKHAAQRRQQQHEAETVLAELKAKYEALQQAAAAQQAEHSALMTTMLKPPLGQEAERTRLDLEVQLQGGRKSRCAQQEHAAALQRSVRGLGAAGWAVASAKARTLAETRAERAEADAAKALQEAGTARAQAEDAGAQLDRERARLAARMCGLRARAKEAIEAAETKRP